MTRGGSSSSTPVMFTYDTFVTPSPNRDDSPMVTRQRSMSVTRETAHLTTGTNEEGHKYVNEYVILRKLGSGSYGKVKLCANSVDGQLYAIKVFRKSLLRKKRTGTTTALEDVLREIAIMKLLSHPHIVELYEVIDDPSEDRLYMVMEYVERGAIMKGTVKNEPLPEALCRKYVRDVMLGLEYLHYQHIIHRDIKPENLLVDRDGRVKISDFGVSHIFTGDENELLRRTAGSPAFLAPEMCSGDDFAARPVDIWSLGISLYIFIFGYPPFISNNLLDLYSKIKTDPVKLPKKIPDDLKDFLMRMLDKDPATRITINGMKVHPWITEDGAYPFEKTDYAQVSNEAQVAISPSAADIAGAVRSKARFSMIRNFTARVGRAASAARRRLSLSGPSSSAMRPFGSDDSQPHPHPPSALHSIEEAPEEHAAVEGEGEDQNEQGVVSRSPQHQQQLYVRHVPQQSAPSPLRQLLAEKQMKKKLESQGRLRQPITDPAHYSTSTSTTNTATEQTNDDDEEDVMVKTPDHGLSMPRHHSAIDVPPDQFIAASSIADSDGHGDDVFEDVEEEEEEEMSYSTPLPRRDVYGDANARLY